jgi:hypothetical protein
MCSIVRTTIYLHINQSLQMYTVEYMLCVGRFEGVENPRYGTVKTFAWQQRLYTVQAKPLLCD